MKPSIDQTSFGSITIEGTVFEHDVIIRLNGLVEKRKHFQVDLQPTPMAIRAWNESEGAVTGLFHVTC